MGYYVRILSTSNQVVSVTRLEDALKHSGFAAKIEYDPGTELTWEQITLSHESGPAIAAIERNEILPDSLGESELGEFLDDLEGERPTAGAEWLKNYFPRVRSIYALQLLSGTEIGNGWDILGCVKASIWNFAPSIFQADAEGFSNEAGYHILWQFSDSVKGRWAMGILKDSKWIHFQMDLGNRQHRKAFCEGQIPNGVSIIE